MSVDHPHSGGEAPYGIPKQNGVPSIFADRVVKSFTSTTNNHQTQDTLNPHFVSKHGILSTEESKLLISLGAESDVTSTLQKFDDFCNQVFNFSSFEERERTRRILQKIRKKLFPETDWGKQIMDNAIEGFSSRTEALFHHPQVIGSILERLLKDLSMVEEVREGAPRTPVIFKSLLKADRDGNSYHTEIKGEEVVRKSIGEAIIELQEKQKMVQDGSNQEAFENYQKAINLCYLFADKFIHGYHYQAEPFMFTSKREIEPEGDEIITINIIELDGTVSTEKKVISFTENSSD